MSAALFNPRPGMRTMQRSAFLTPRRAGARLLALAALAPMGACAVGPNYVAPFRPAEKAYLAHPVTDLGQPGTDEQRQHLTLGAGPDAQWWTRFQSPELNRTVGLALDSNWSIEAANANLAAADQRVKVARGGLYPQIDAVGGVADTQYGASFLGPEARTFPIFGAATVGLNIKYDLDLFGGTHRRIEQSNAMAAFQREALNAVHVSVAENAVVQAVEIASVRAQIDALGKVVASDQQTLDLVRAARGVGAVSDIDVTTAQSQLDRDRTLLPPLVQRLNAAQDALPLLVGKSPSLWSAPDFTLASLTLPEDLPVAVPSELIRARPDIRAAESQLHAASAAVGVATADLYPKVTLSAAISEDGVIGGAYGPAWNLFGGLTAPIFHGGALTAQRRAAEQAYRAAFAQYQQTVLMSFGQVATTLHALANDAEAVRTQKAALASADKALRLTRLGYGVGNAGIVQVLEAQRLEQLAQFGLVQARAQRYLDTVRFFVVAGGGVEPGAGRSGA